MAFFPWWHTVNTRRLNTNWKGIIKTKAKKNAKRHLSSVGTRGFHRKHCTYPLFPLGTTASAPRPCCGLRNSFPKSRTGGARGNCTSIAKALGNVKILSGVYKGASLKISDDLERFPDAREGTGANAQRADVGAQVSASEAFAMRFDSSVLCVYFRNIFFGRRPRNNMII